MVDIKKEKTENKALSLVKKLYPIVIEWIFIFLIFELKENLRIPVFERQFSIYDESLSHPCKWKNEQIKWNPLLHYTLTACVVVIVIVQLVKRKWKYELNQPILGLFLAYLTCNVFTEYLKNFAGRYRPDFLTVCDIDFDKVQQQFLYYQNITKGIDIENFGPRNLFNTTICKTNKFILYDEHKSFPSGHSSFAFVAGTYLALYLAGQLRMFDGKCRIWKYCIVCVPVFLATYVPFSRLMDYRHHWEDVLAGTLIGIFFGVIVYYFFYPSLRDPNCDIPIRGKCQCCFFGKNKKQKEKIDEVEEDETKPEETKAEQMV